MKGKQQKLYSHKLEQVLVLAQSFLSSLPSSPPPHVWRGWYTGKPGWYHRRQ